MSCVGVGVVLCCLVLLGFGSCCVVLYGRDSNSLATMLMLRCGCVVFALWCLLHCAELSVCVVRVVIVSCCVESCCVAIELSCVGLRWVAL